MMAPFFSSTLQTNFCVRIFGKYRKKKHRITSQRAIKKSSIIIANKRRKKLHYDVTRIHLFLWGRLLGYTKKSNTTRPAGLNAKYKAKLVSFMSDLRPGTKRAKESTRPFSFSFFMLREGPPYDLMIHRLVVHT